MIQTRHLEQKSNKWRLTLRVAALLLLKLEAEYLLEIDIWTQERKMQKQQKRLLTFCALLSLNTGSHG